MSEEDRPITAPLQKQQSKNSECSPISCAPQLSVRQSQPEISKAQSPRSTNQLKRRPIVAKVRQLNAAQIFAVAPDDDVEGYRTRLKELFATASPLFVDASIRQLLAAAKLPATAVATTTSLSASLELIASLEPSNETEAALAVHIACLHLTSLSVLARMHGVLDRNVVPMAAAASKLERAFRESLDTFQRLKRGPTQVVRVERVEIQSGAQALIGCDRNN